MRVLFLEALNREREDLPTNTSTSGAEKRRGDAQQNLTKTAERPEHDSFRLARPSRRFSYPQITQITQTL